MMIMMQTMMTIRMLVMMINVPGNMVNWSLSMMPGKPRLR